MYALSSSKFCRYLSYFIIGIWTYGSLCHCRLAVLERSVVSLSRFSRGVTPAEAWAPGAPGDLQPRQLDWKKPFQKSYNTVWSGEMRCGSDPARWGGYLASRGYQIMAADPTWDQKNNLVAAFCIPSTAAGDGVCFLGTIPDRDGNCARFVETQMAKDPVWKKAFGDGNYLEYHAEDYAIALAVEAEHKYPFTAAGQPQAFMSVYGKYSPGSEPITEPAGDRWPCTSILASQYRNAPCTKVLSDLNIGFTFKPKNNPF